MSLIMEWIFNYTLPYQNYELQNLLLKQLFVSLSIAVVPVQLSRCRKCAMGWKNEESSSRWEKCQQLTNLMQKILFYNKFIIRLYMFRALLCSSSWGQNSIIQHLVSSHLQVAVRCTVLSQPVHRTATYRCDDTRCCIIQFWPPDGEHNCARDM